MRHFAREKEMPAKQRANKMSKRPRVPRIGPKLDYMPDAAVVQMGFSITGAISETTSGSGVTFTLALNNLYDPVTAVGGMQPVPFDQWSTMFNRFRVLRVKYRITVLSQANINVDIGTVAGVTLSTINAMPNDTSSWPVQPFTSSALLASFNSPRGMKTFSRSIQPWSPIGLRREQYVAEMEYSHTAIAGPAKSLYLIIWATGATAQAAKVTYQATLTYDVEISERKPLGHS
jgi:hypothetical protein